MDSQTIIYYLSGLSFLLLNSKLYIHITIKMPRIKQSSKKNLKDAPNPTNWASNLRNKYCKYFYLFYAPGFTCTGIFCAWTDVFCYRTDLSHHSFKYMCTQSCINFFCADCDRMGVYCHQMVTFCAWTDIHIITLISYFSRFKQLSTTSI